MFNQHSVLMPISLGIVVTNKPTDSNEVEVTLIEKTNLVDGELTDQVQELGTEINQRSFTPAKSTVSVKAKWLNINSPNRITSPDVRRGEKVIVYQLGNTDKYYWVTYDSEDILLRKLETVILAFSATKDENAELTPDNYYLLEISTHNKRLRLSTSSANGEPFKYNVELNTAEGFITVTDDINNFMHMDSAEHIIKFRNSDNSIVELNKKDILLQSEESVRIKTKKLIEEIGESITINTSRLSESVSGNAVRSASQTTLNSKLTVNGSTKINGGLSTSGGGVAMSGDVNVEGTVNATGNVSAPNIR